jgi:hypothetical protein
MDAGHERHGNDDKDQRREPEEQGQRRARLS